MQHAEAMRGLCCSTWAVARMHVPKEIVWQAVFCTIQALKRIHSRDMLHTECAAPVPGCCCLALSCQHAT